MRAAAQGRTLAVLVNQSDCDQLAQVVRQGRQWHTGAPLHLTYRQSLFAGSHQQSEYAQTCFVAQRPKARGQFCNFHEVNNTRS